MKVYTKEQLDNMTDKEMKRMAFNELGLVGLSKKPKAEVIKAILKSQNVSGGTQAAFEKPAISSFADPIKSVSGNFKSVLSRPGATFGNRTDTTIQVSSGANVGNFNVVGRKVSEVAEFLR